MKKEYKKPSVYIESLVVSEFVAGTCDIDVGFSETTCVLYDDTYQDIISVYFATTPCEEDPRGSICYHSSIDPNAYFGS